MKRELLNKKLINTRLANNYGGWIYCTQCDQNIGYLCYVTYDQFTLEYECICGSKGTINLEFDNQTDHQVSKSNFVVIKNRFCCPNDESPLFTIISKNVLNYKSLVVCHNCKFKFEQDAIITHS